MGEFVNGRGLQVVAWSTAVVIAGLNALASDSDRDGWLSRTAKSDPVRKRYRIVPV